MKKIIASFLVCVLALTSSTIYADDNNGGGGGGGGGGGAAILGLAVAGILIWALSGKKTEPFAVDKSQTPMDLPNTNSASQVGTKDTIQNKQPVDGIGTNKKLEY